MCDYSLEIYASRPAVQGEQYVLHRFRSGTAGFVSAVDCNTAVCMPAGAKLRLEAIDEPCNTPSEFAPWRWPR